MKFKVPDIFPNQFLAAALLYNEFEKTWPSIRDIAKEIKSDAFKQKYINQHVLHESTPLEISRAMDVAFVIKENNNFDKIGEGSTLCINNANIYFWVFIDPIHFYYVPKGIKIGSKILSRLDDIINFINDESEPIRIEPCPLKLNQLRSAEQKYNVSLAIWQKKEVISKHYTFACKRVGANNKSLTITLHYQKESNNYLFIHNKAEYFQNYFICKNFKLGCLYTFSRKKKLKEHEVNCITPEEAIKKMEELDEDAPDNKVYLVQVDRYCDPYAR